MERLTDLQLRQIARAAHAAIKREGDGVWRDGEPREELGRLVTSDGRRAVADYAYGETRLYMAAACPAVVLELVRELLEHRKGDKPRGPCVVDGAGQHDPALSPGSPSGIACGKCGENLPAQGSG